ncbi:MAG TPA: cupin domain-containing protein [Fodinibius sp.]|nr:cupin domain-containing protein [Fodinibius sp.]
MKKIKPIHTSCLAVAITLLLLPAFQAMAQQESNQIDTIFPKGEKIANDNFNDPVWVNALVTADSANQNAVGNVIFASGVRSDWHSHPAGQIILATGGVGYYQEKGSPKQILRKGDVVKCPPNVSHWHGASRDQAFVQLAITGREHGPTEWLRPVREVEYHK